MKNAPLTPVPDASSSLPSSEIQARAVRGVTSSFAALLVSQIVRFAFGVFLARKLTPDDFGLVAIVIALTVTFDIFRDQGLTLAIIQAKELDETRLHSAFWFMTALTLAEVLILMALAPAVAVFYNRSELGLLMTGLSAGSAVSGMAAIPLALLKRHMHFDRLSRIQLASLLLSIPVVTAAASAGWGYWALAVYMVFPPFLTLLGAWKYCDWRPRLVFSRQALAPLTATGRRFFGVDLLTYWSQMADALILGRLLSGSLLGLYQRAQNTRLLATSMVDSTLVPITLSGLSRLQDRPDSFWKAYQTSAYAIGAVLAPACILLTLAPAECLGYVFGAQWIPAAPVMRTTALLFLLYPLARTTHSGFLALGRPDLLFRWLLVATALLVAGFLVGQRWGLQGITVGMVLAQTVSLPVGLFAFATQGRTTVAALFKPVVPVMAATLTVGLIAFPFTRMAGPVTVTAWPRLAIALAAVAAFGLFMAFHVKHSASGQLITKTLHPSLPPALRPWLARLAGLPTPPSPL